METYRDKNGIVHLSEFDYNEILILLKERVLFEKKVLRELPKLSNKLPFEVTEVHRNQFKEQITQLTKLIHKLEHKTEITDPEEINLITETLDLEITKLNFKVGLKNHLKEIEKLKTDFNLN